MLPHVRDLGARFLLADFEYKSGGDLSRVQAS
jgi:hypothetical protein